MRDQEELKANHGSLDGPAAHGHSHDGDDDELRGAETDDLGTADNEDRAMNGQVHRGKKYSAQGSWEIRASEDVEEDDDESEEYGDNDDDTAGLDGSADGAYQWISTSDSMDLDARASVVLKKVRTRPSPCSAYQRVSLSLRQWW